MRLIRNLPKKNTVKGALFKALLIGMLLTTFFVLPPEMISSSSPAVQYSLVIAPTRIQEGLSANLTFNLEEATANTTYAFTVNVTSPANDFHLFNFTVSTNGTGSGSNLTKFPTDFVAPANTSLVGVYRVTVNQTLATANFTVGLTDDLTYLRTETVNIRGAGYNANETVLVDVKLGNASVSGFPRAVNASAEGVVTDSWAIPSNALLGVYTATLFNATTTVKSVADVQTFTVEGVVEVQTRNLADEPVAGVTVEVYNAPSGIFTGLTQTTNSTGWARFEQLKAGNYTFKAFMSNVEVGAVNQTIAENIAVLLTLRLSNMKLQVKDEAGGPLPLIDLNVQFNYTTRTNQTLSAGGSLTTSFNGAVQLQNVFAGIGYTIEARRYDSLFNTTRIQSLSLQGWNNFTIIVPTYAMLVQVFDSKGNSAEGLDVAAYEWSSGITAQPLQSGRTDSTGNVTFALTFGRYRLRLSKDTTFVSEVTVDLVQNPTSAIVRNDVYNVDLTARVVDYFGQPIPNALVEFERKVGSDYQTSKTLTTGADGVARFEGLIGGDSRVVMSTGGTSQIQYLSLVGPGREVFFKLDGYVSVAGFIMDTSQFVTLILLVICVVAFVLFSTYKRLLRLFQRQKK